MKDPRRYEFPKSLKTINVNDKAWSKAIKDNGSFIILDDYKMLLQMKYQIPSKMTKFFDKIKKYNSGISINFVKHKSMTPKKKAKELYEKFYNQVPSRIMHFELHCTLAKSNAIICIDEMIENSTDGCGECGGTTYDKEFLCKVKKQIQKL